MISEYECESSMYVEVVYIYRNDDTFTAKLSDTEPITPDTDDEEALTGVATGYVVRFVSEKLVRKG